MSPFRSFDDWLGAATQAPRPMLDVTMDFPPAGIDPSLWERIKRGSLSTLGWTAETLDRPANTLRGLLVGEWHNPFGERTPEEVTTGREILSKWFDAPENREGFHPLGDPADALMDVLGFGAEVATDPITYLSGGLTKAGQLAAKGTTVAKATKALEEGGKFAQQLHRAEELAIAGKKGYGRIGEKIGAYTTAKERRELLEEAAEKAIEAEEKVDFLPLFTARREAQRLGAEYLLPETAAEQAKQGMRAWLRLRVPFGPEIASFPGVKMYEGRAALGRWLQTAPVVGQAGSALRRMFSTGKSRQGLKDALIETQAEATSWQHTWDRNVLDILRKSDLPEASVMKLARGIEAAPQEGLQWKNLTAAENAVAKDIIKFDKAFREASGRPELGSGLDYSIAVQKKRLEDATKAELAGGELAALQDEVAENLHRLTAAKERVPGYFPHGLTNDGMYFERAGEHIGGFNRLDKYSTIDPMTKTRKWTEKILDREGNVIGERPLGLIEINRLVKEQADEFFQYVDWKTLERQFPQEVAAMRRFAEGKAKYFEETPAKALLTSIAKATKARRNVKLAERLGTEYGVHKSDLQALEKLIKEGAKEGADETAVATGQEAAKLAAGIRKGMEQGPGTIFGDFYFPKDIAAELRQIEGRYNSPEWAAGVLNLWTTGIAMYKSMLTKYFPGYHGRNVLSDMFLSAQADAVLSPVPYIKSVQYLATNAGRMNRPVTVAGFSQQQLTKLSRDLDLERSLFSIQEASPLAQTVAKTRLGRAIVKTEDVATKVTTGGERFTRMAHWFDLLEKGWSPEAAAKRVKQVHFDYTDLTDFEKKYARNTITFYTWSRKNLEWQMKRFLEAPGIMGAYARLYAANVDPNSPDYDREGLNLELARRRIGMFGTPIDEVFSHLVKKPTVAKTMQATLARAAGMLAPPLRAGVEAATGFNLFFGQPIEQRTRAQEIYDWTGLDSLMGLRRDPKGILRGDPWALWLPEQLPTSRAVRTISQFLEPDVDLTTTALRTALGPKFSQYHEEPDLERIRKQRIREVLDEAVREGRAARYQSFYRPAGSAPDPEIEALIRALSSRR